MKPDFFAILRMACAAFLLCVAGQAAAGDSDYGIAMYGKPALPPDFVSLPYANPDAPKGGKLVLGDVGSFDSLNPYILKGTAPWMLSHLTVESLLGRSYDEPFTLYGLLADSVRTGPNRRWVEFTLNPKARFSDGKPVTVADVLWSFRTLATKGDPRYAAAWSKVASAKKVGPRTVRFTFTSEDRELPLILGLRPVLEKAQWKDRDFAQSSLVPPVGSGPYVVDKVEPGRLIVFRKNPDWWGRDLPFNRGRFNFKTIRYEYFGDRNAMFEAFKAGELSLYREPSPARWKTNYDFPAVRAGRVVLSKVPNKRPSGIAGLVFNTRRGVFADWRVRQALIDAFNFEFINKTLNAGAEPRITSYFSNSVLGMSHGPATGEVRSLLEPFAATLPPGALSGYSLPRSNGTESDRPNILHAKALLAKAGWHVEDGVLRDATGRPFRFEILLPQGHARIEAAVNIYVQALKRLGIAAEVTTVDSAQYTERTNTYDFDMTYYVRALSLSPGTEQWLYWGHQGVTEPGTRNWMGMDSPAAEAMIRKLLTSTSHADFIAAARALDRVLTTGRYVIPFWFSNVSRIAHLQQIKYPAHLPIYGDWLGFLPDVWWHED